AFLRAWHTACASNTGGRVLVPRGSYVLGAVVFLGPCKGPAQSNVQIRNVTFSDVRGTSTSQLAVKLQCSKNVPCEDIKLKNIMLAYHGPEGPVASSCINAGGRSYGFQLPSGCL
nr:exopolygalacturonase-like [Tanacetum cinerariifolium]